MDNLDSGNSKKNILLITPMLHQGGFERVCLTTARLLSKCYHVTVAVFSLEDLAFDITGLDVIDLQLKAREGFAGKLLNVCKRVRKLKRLKKEKHIDVSYSFGATANLANVLSRMNDQIWTGVRGFAALGNRRLMQFVCNKSDKVVCCSKAMASEMSKKYYAKEIVTLWNPCDIDQIQSQAAAMILSLKISLIRKIR